ncbi:MAG: hypothetical protein FE834_06355 [Gammaproteobacteria bacterium]|nr:hypothetical protein [Gammaproteobacteria bacterium]
MKFKNPLIEDASGSIGDLTVANGNGGLYMKFKPQPKNPKTNRQKAIRQFLSEANVAWKLMSPEIREEWSVWGKTLIKFDRLKNKIVVNGWSAFSGSYVLCKQASMSVDSLIAGAPAIANYSSSKGCVINYDSAMGKFDIYGNSDVDEVYSFYWGGSLRSTINVNKSGYQYDTNGSASLTSFLSIFKGAGAKTNNFIRVVKISADGRHSEPTDYKVYVDNSNLDGSDKASAKPKNDKSKGSTA